MSGSKKYLLRKKAEEILLDLEKLNDNIKIIKKDDVKKQIEIIGDEVDELIDQQMTSEMGGAGEYLRNMREAEKKRKE